MAAPDGRRAGRPKNQKRIVALHAPKVSLVDRGQLVFGQWSKWLALGAFALASLMLLLAGAIYWNVPREKPSPPAALALNPAAHRPLMARVNLAATIPQTDAGPATLRGTAILPAVECEDPPVPAAWLSGPLASPATTVAISASASAPAPAQAHALALSPQARAPLPVSTNRSPTAVGPAGVKTKPKSDGTHGLLACLKARSPVLHEARLRDGTQERNLLDLPGALCPHSEFVERKISPCLALWSLQTNANNGSSQLTILAGLYREAIRCDQRRISFLGDLVVVGETPNGSNTVQLFWRSR